MSNMSYKQMISQFIVYNLGGLSSYLLSVVATWIGVQIVGEYYWWIYALALVICYVYLSFFHFFVTFKNKTASLVKAMLKFSVVFVVFAYANVLLADFFIVNLQMYYIVGITLAGLLISIITYGVNKILVFK